MAAAHPLDPAIPALDPASWMENPGDALDRLRPITPAFATVPIEDGFNWQEALPDLPALHWYLVVFRSVRRPEADSATLTRLDDLAHEEASQAPGFLYYFKGELGARGECLSFCLWRRQEDARQAGRGALHREAALIAGAMYESYHLERYQVERRQAGLPPTFTPVAAATPGSPHAASAPHSHAASASVAGAIDRL